MPPFRFAPVESPLAAAAQGATQGFERGQGLALRQQRGAREEARFDQEQSKARMDTLANVMRSADTPEKHAQAIQLLQGQGFDFDPEELDFNNREAIVNQALSIRDQLAGERADRAFEATQAQRGVQNELARAGLAATQSNNAFNRGVRLQELDISRQGLDVKREAAAKKSASGGLKDEKDLRQEFQKLTKDFRVVRDASERIKASAENPSAAGDLALIFNFMKVLDPGSTVREGEFATAQNAAGVPERVRAQLNSVLSGERLSDTQRKDFTNRGDVLFKRRQKQFGSTEKQFRTLAERNNLNPENVVLDFNPVDQGKGPPTIDDIEAEIRRRGL